MEFDEREKDDLSKINVAWNVRARAQNQLRLELVAKGYVVFGFLIAAIALLYFYVSTLQIHLNENQTLAVIAAAGGLTIAAMGWLLLAIKRRQSALATEKLMEWSYASEFVQAWAHFERLARMILSAEKENFNQYSIRSMIAKLYQDNRINQADLGALQEALELRNLIVHGRADISGERIARQAAKMSEVIAKLSQNLGGHESVKG